LDTGKLLDREHERALLLDALKKASSGDPQLVVVWGRRRVGKTYLLSHVRAGRRSVFFGATQQSEAIELGRLAEAVRRDLGDDVADQTGGGFSGWEAALRYFAGLAKSDPLLVILDEVPYLSRSTPGFASIVQAVWDHLPACKLTLVLTGSAIGTIEQMLGASGPLRGRPTLTMRLDPLDLIAARAFLPGMADQAYFEAYAATGGYPLHLKSWDRTATTDENLFALAGSGGGILVEDAPEILAEELAEAAGYPRILAAIGRGRHRISEIANDAAQRVDHPLDVLIRTGFVRRSVPVGAPKAARPLYEIDDVYLAFWFAVLYSDLALIDGGQGRSVLRRRSPEWQRHLGAVFEAAARQHAVRMVESGELPNDLVVGRWWAQSGAQCEVDVLGLSGTATALLGEARWQSRPLGLRDLAELSAKRALVPRTADEAVLALWGRAGAEPSVRKAGARTFGLRDVLRAR
jgi:AAA+ ATPase superfamily predicted ATPase